MRVHTHISKEEALTNKVSSISPPTYITPVEIERLYSNMWKTPRPGKINQEGMLRPSPGERILPWKLLNSSGTYASCLNEYRDEIQQNPQTNKKPYCLEQELTTVRK